MLEHAKKLMKEIGEFAELLYCRLSKRDVEILDKHIQGIKERIFDDIEQIGEQEFNLNEDKLISYLHIWQRIFNLKEKELKNHLKE